MNAVSKIVIGAISFCVFTGGWLLMEGTVRKDLIHQHRALQSCIKRVSNIASQGEAGRYQIARAAASILIALASAGRASVSLTKALEGILLAVAVYFLLIPKDEIKGFKSPYKIICELKLKSKRKQYKEELSNISVQMKNIIASSESGSITTNFLLTSLLPYAKTTKPFFAKMISLNMKGEKARAAEYFEDVFGFKLAKDFVYIVQRIDEMPAEEFMPSVNALISNFRQEKETELADYISKKQNIMFTVASFEVLVLIANFMVLIFISTIGQVNNLT